MVVGLLFQAKADWLVILFELSHFGTGLFVADLSGVELVSDFFQAMNKKRLIKKGFHRISERGFRNEINILAVEGESPPATYGLRSDQLTIHRIAYGSKR